MSYPQELVLVSPNALPTDKGEAELFGAMVWLWMHSTSHRRCPLSELERLLLPALKTGQYVLALEKSSLQRPVGMVTWAWMTHDMERRYLQELDRSLMPQDWQQGDRPWILDWLAPFGHTRVLVQAVRRLLHRACFRSLYHKGDQSGLRVLHFRGADLTPEDEARFWSVRPLGLTGTP